MICSDSSHFNIKCIFNYHLWYNSDCKTFTVVITTVALPVRGQISFLLSIDQLLLCPAISLFMLFLLTLHLNLSASSESFLLEWVLYVYHPHSSLSLTNTSQVPAFPLSQTHGMFHYCLVCVHVRVCECICVYINVIYWVHLVLCICEFVFRASNFGFDKLSWVFPLEKLDAFL